jgi:hypothetical protein
MYNDFPLNYQERKKKTKKKSSQIKTKTKQNKSKANQTNKQTEKTKKKIEKVKGANKKPPMDHHKKKVGNFRSKFQIPIATLPGSESFWALQCLSTSGNEH